MYLFQRTTEYILYAIAAETLPESHDSEAFRSTGSSYRASFYPYITNAVFADSQQKPESVFMVEFPVFHCDIQQPAFGNESIEKGKSVCDW
uniref:Uncharacterized protein n=1 Tax=Faecalibaculum rodentium TaxID=1702221 RepID=A0A140DXU4_9FIRM|nr:hypothetical protein AALO17_23370 [Faecalibaculum rodentium]